jgi:hypothetical protein
MERVVHAEFARISVCPRSFRRDLGADALGDGEVDLPVMAVTSTSPRIVLCASPSLMPARRSGGRSSSWPFTSFSLHHLPAWMMRIPREWIFRDRLAAIPPGRSSTAVASPPLWIKRLRARGRAARDRGGRARPRSQVQRLRACAQELAASRSISASGWLP